MLFDKSGVVTLGCNIHDQMVGWVLVVPVGTEVRFPNHDTVRHHVYLFSPARKFGLKL